MCYEPLYLDSINGEDNGVEDVCNDRSLL